MQLVIQTGPVNYPVPLHPGQTYVIGAKSPADGIYPDIDLDPYDTGKYVSRTHAYLQTGADGTVQLTDAGSTNGTSVNSRPLTPGTPRVLRDGDLVMFGNAVICTYSAQPAAGVQQGPSRSAPTQEYVAGQPVAPQTPPVQPLSVPRPASAKPLERPPTPSVAAPPARPAAPPPTPSPEPGRAQRAVVAIDAHKSYVGAAFLTWFLYYVGFYLIGLILNIVYLSDASKYSRATGRSPSGAGCLTFLLVVHLAIPVILFILLLAGILSLPAFF